MRRKQSLVSEVIPCPRNPLLEEIFKVQGRVVHLKEEAKNFYFRVLLSQYECPECGGHLVMTGQSQCSCSCGNIVDPTLAFQWSPCCAARLVRKTFHYACSRCQQAVPSRFLFDERLFDKAYFREMMQESRERAKTRREEIRRLLAGSRSDPLVLMETPCIHSIPGLAEDLNDFIGTKVEGFIAFETKSDFRMEDYRNHILSVLQMGRRRFSAISPLLEDCRMDKVWRFVTLIFMEQDLEIHLTQYGPDILVERVRDEAYVQG
jgi:hypothetical protein